MKFTLAITVPDNLLSAHWDHLNTRDGLTSFGGWLGHHLMAVGQVVLSLDVDCLHRLIRSLINYINQWRSSAQLAAVLLRVRYVVEENLDGQDV